ISKGNQDLAAFFIVAGGIDLIFILLWSNRAHYLTLDTRLESPSFFQKYKEESGKQGVTAVISSLIGGVIGYFIWTLSEVMFILYPSHVKIATDGYLLDSPSPYRLWFRF